jgi:hypothetical protein
VVERNTGGAGGAKQELFLAAHRGAQVPERGVGARPELPHRLRCRAGVRGGMVDAARKGRRTRDPRYAAALAVGLRELHQALWAPVISCHIVQTIAT